MASSNTSNDFVADVLGKLTSGQRPTSSLTTKATKYYRSVTQRLLTCEPIFTKNAKAGFVANYNNDFVADVLLKLNSGRHPPMILIQKAVKYYASVRKTLVRYEGVISEKRIAEVGTSEEDRLDTSRGKPENVLTLSSIIVTAKQVDTPLQEDRDKHELFKVMAANAKHISENKKLKEALDIATSEIEHLTEQIQAQIENDEIYRQNKQLKNELAVLKEENRSLCEESRNLNRDLKPARDETDKKTRQANIIRKDLENATDANRRISSENWNLKKELGSAKDKIESQSKEILRQNKKADRNAEDDSIRRDLQTVQGNYTKLNDENTALKQELQSAQHEKEKQSRHALARKHDKDREMNSMKEEIEVLKKANQRLDSENTSLKRDLDTAEQNRKQQLEQIQQLSENVGTPPQDNPDKRELLKLMEANAKHICDNKKLKETLNTANNEIEHLSKQIQKQMENKNETATEVAVVRKELEHQKDANSKTNAENTTMKRELTSAKDANSRTNAENASLKRELTSAKDEVVRQLKQIKELATTVQNLKQDDSAENVIQRLTEENERLGSEITKITQKLKEADSEIQKKTIEIEEANQKRDNLRSDAENTRMLEKQKELNKKLTDENKKLEDDVNDLKNRFSALASHKMTADNPDIADLSDLYRPTNIAEQFRQVYDDEWTEAYEELEKESLGDETKPIDTLAAILKSIETFCVEVSSQQFDALKSTVTNEMTYPKYHHHSGTVIAGRHRAELSVTQTELADKLLKDLRKSLGILSTGPLTQIFHQVYVTEYKHEDSAVSSKLNYFFVQAVKLVWMMKMQAPPMGFIWAEANETVDKNKFTFYTKRGEIIKQCIWPAVVLHENGPVMSKGIVQAV